MNFKHFSVFSLLIILPILVSCQTPKDKKEPTLPDPLAAGWEGQQVCELLQDDQDLRILRCTFPPGVGHEKHYHPKHTGYTLKGGKFRITDTTGTREVNIPDGYMFQNDTIVWHEVLNIGSDTAIFLIIEPQ